MVYNSISIRYQCRYNKFCETVDNYYKICYYTISSSTFVVEGIGEPGLNF